MKERRYTTQNNDDDLKGEQRGMRLCARKIDTFLWRPRVRVYTYEKRFIAGERFNRLVNEHQPIAGPVAIYRRTFIDTVHENVAPVFGDTRRVRAIDWRIAWTVNERTLDAIVTCLHDGSCINLVASLYCFLSSLQLYGSWSFVFISVTRHTRYSFLQSDNDRTN